MAAEKENDGALRLFVALCPDERLAHAVVDAVAPHVDRRSFRTTPVASLHLTLAFLGNVESSAVAELCRSLGAALDGARAPRIRLGGTGAFPSLRRPRVLWVEIAEEGQEGILRDIHARVARAVARCGIEAADQDRAWTPHLTVARVRGGGGGRASVTEGFGELRIDLPWPVDAVCLMRSELGTGPASYTCLARFPLAPPDAS